jgi:hypothetical protein
MIESLIFAILECKYELMEELLSNDPRLIRSLDREGRSVLQWLTVTGDPRSVCIFHKYGIPSPDTDKENNPIYDNPFYNPDYAFHLRYLRMNNLLNIRKLTDDKKYNKVYINYICTFLGFTFNDIGLDAEDVRQALLNTSI